MPSPEVASLKQRAVLWTPNGVNRFGENTLAAPVEIRCRWEETTGERIDPQSGAIKSTGSIKVDRVIPVDSILWLGKLVDVPSDPKDLRQVISFNQIPDIKGRISERSVTVMRLSTALPTVTG